MSQKIDISDETSVEIDTKKDNEKDNEKDIEKNGEKSNDKEIIEKLNLEVESYKDKYLRAYAEFENSKKRLERDKQNAISYANEKFATDILSVLDSFENALISIKSLEKENEESDIFKKVEEGVTLTFEQLKKILIKNHIVEIESIKEFNPEHHQAIMTIEDEKVESGDIVQVMQKGYKIKDRVLRAAMVTTAK